MNRRLEEAERAEADAVDYLRHMARAAIVVLERACACNDPLADIDESDVEEIQALHLAHESLTEALESHESAADALAHLRDVEHLLGAL